jgi:Na+-transporting methylmalonyl-CoA/oxaloacetate decarboxylase gamma subunit
MTKKLAVVLLLLLLGALVAYFIQDFVRQTLLYPLVYLYWSLRLVYEGVPGIVWWFILLGILLLLALSSLKRRKEPPGLAPEANNQIPSRPQTWMRRLKNKNQGDYFSWQLAREISTLALTCLADRNRLTPAAARDELLAGRFNLPQHIQAYLLAGSLPNSYNQYLEMKTNIQLPGTGSPLELDPEEIISFLEAEQER